MVRRFLMLLFSLFTIGNAHSQIGAISTKLTAFDAEGNAHNVRAFVYKNEWNRTEVRLESADLPRIAPGVNVTLGYGRDFDDDGKIESWFMFSSSQGFVRYTLPGNHPYGFDIIQRGLFSQYQSSILTEANVFFSALVSYLSLGASRVINSQKTYFKEMLDYEEISVRLERSQSMGLQKLSSEQIKRMRILLHEGYRRSYEKMQKGQNEEFYALVVADIALWMSGGIVVKYLGKGFKLSGKILLKVPGVEIIKTMLVNASKKLLGFAARGMTRLQHTLGAAMSAAKVAAVKALSGTALKDALSKIVRGLITRSRIAGDVKLMMKFMKKFVHKESFTAVSIGAGMWGDLRAEAVKKEEPTRLIQSIVHSSQMQNEIVQCVTDQKAKGTTVEYQIQGILNLDQKTMSVVREQDYQSVAYDIGSKIAIDPVKDAMNEVALSYIENIVTETRQPKLMGVGYVVIVASEIRTGRVKNKFTPDSPILCPIRVASN